MGGGDSKPLLTAIPCQGQQSPCRAYRLALHLHMRLQEEREKAARGLVEALAASQAEFAEGSASEGADEEEEEEGEHADQQQGGGARRREDPLHGCSPLLVYAVRRLCRGLASSRQGARQGFALALSSLLRRLDCVGTGQVLAVLDDVLEPAGKVGAVGCVHLPQGPAAEVGP